MKLFKSQINRKVLHKYLISFILVFIIPSIFIVWFFNRYTSDMIINKAEAELTTKFVRSYDEMEKRLIGIKDLALRFSLDNDTLSIANTSEVDSDVLVKMSQYTKRLNEVCVFNNYIKSVAVHIRSNDVVLAERGKSGFYIYFDQLKKITGISADDMMELLKKRNYINIVPVNDDNLQNQERRITLIQSFPVSLSEPVGSIILTLDKGILTQVTGGSEEKVHDDFLIVDENKNILVSKNNDSISKDALAELINNGSAKIQKLVIDGKKSIALCKKSNLNQWWYVYHLPETEMTSNILDFKRLMSVIVLVYILGGICISLLLAVLNYNPIRSIINEIVRKDMFKLPNEKTEHSGNDEYDIIRRYITDLKNEKNILNSKITTYLSEVKSNFLRDLTIEGLDSSKFAQLSETLDLKFIYQDYCFVTFSCDSPDDISSNDVNKTFFILNMIEETAIKFGIGHKFILGKDLVGLILNIKDGVSINDIIASYSGLVDYVKATYDRQMMVGIGDIYKGYENIPFTYNEACDAVKYSIFYGLSIFSYNEMLKIRHSKYYLTSEVFDKLVNCVEAGDYDSSDSLITQVMAYNFTNNVLSLNEVHKLYYELMGILKKAADKFNVDIFDLCAIDKTIPMKNENHKTLEEMSSTIRHLYRNACCFIKQSRAKAADNNNADIMKYISDNYFDANLSCSYVADKFNISQSYLSNMVKKHTNICYSDYVNQLRIESAKVLLLENEFSINDIAFKLGYGSSNTFIRTFKNYEGVTPGQFKSSSVFTNKLKDSNHVEI